MPLGAASKKLSKFDTNTFLSTINGGRTILVFSKKQAAQGDSADAVFLHKGRKKTSRFKGLGSTNGAQKFRDLTQAVGIRRGRKAREHWKKI
jgi:hypothetical protein